jgi:hypothetical protein
MIGRKLSAAEKTGLPRPQVAHPRAHIQHQAQVVVARVVGDLRKVLQLVREEVDDRRLRVADGVGDKRSDVPPEVGVVPRGIPGGFRRRGDD